MMTSREARVGVQNLLDYLLKAEIVLLSNPVTDERGGRITWHPLNHASGELFRRPEPTIAEYMDWVRSGSYSALLFDGSLLQVTFDYDDRALSGYRLAFVPCPFALDQDLVKAEPIFDLLELYAAQSALEVRMRATIRFDFDPRGQRPGHAAAHASLNAAHCRIPCVSAMNLGHFVAFVFQHFYPDIWAVHSYLRELPRHSHVGRTILPEEERFLHLAWRDVHVGA